MLKDKVIEKFGVIPDTMVILGSGINDVIQVLEDKTSISYEILFQLKTDQSIGHAGQLHMGYIDKRPILILEGRKHYYEGVTDEEMRLLIQSFAKIGVKHLVVTNACGGMNESFKPGDIMVIDDHINMLGRNPLVGDKNDLGPKFVDMSEPYDLEFRHIMDQISKAESIPIQHGVYVSYLGPSYETKAEIRAFKILGGDAVGMSTVPEVILARQAGMRVLGLSLITNMSTGISKTPLSHEEVLEVGKSSVKKLSVLLLKFLAHISSN